VELRGELGGAEFDQAALSNRFVLAAAQAEPGDRLLGGVTISVGRIDRGDADPGSRCLCDG